MADSSPVMIEGEDYQVVDECTEEDEAANNSENKTANTMEQEKPKDETVINDTPENKEEQKELKDNNTNDTVMETEECNAANTDQEKKEVEILETKAIKAEEESKASENKIEKPQESDENIEKTAQEKDSGLSSTPDEQMEQDDDKQKEMTDEDVMHHLDEIENIVLTAETFGGDTGKIAEETKESEKKSKGKQEDNKWYEQKLAEKVATIKERLCKLARVLEFSYPHYKKWLDIQEKLHGSPICKLEPPRRCPLDKPYTNRWKFLCSRKSVQESAKEEGSADVTEANKNVETVWRLEPTATWGVNTENDSEFPPFVLRAVKAFEDFLQSTEQPVEQEVEVIDKETDDEVIVLSEKVKDDDENLKEKQEWSWLVVRCNSMDHLMLFATGRYIRRSTMDRLKQVFETGPGKDCNVKSLYCKSINKTGDTVNSNTTFLVGSEALDEVVGGLKIQLAPKTNFWSNAAGAETVAKTVADLLAPTSGTTVLEIGCGIGLIGLMLASTCQQVIGVDSPSEVEEAEMTCELNGIKNVSFIMGSPNDVIGKITGVVKTRKTFAIINANTNIGRAIPLMTALRKINSIRRIVMITTLTKQSVRAILELTRPGDRSLGHPFMPIQACVVDTLPVGPHFEVVIRMERRMMHKYLQPRMNNVVVNADSNKSSVVPSSSYEKLVPNPVAMKKVIAAKGSPAQGKKVFDKPSKKPKAVAAKKNPVGKISQNVANVQQKPKFVGKRVHSPERHEVPPKKVLKKFDKFGVKNWRPDLPQSKASDLRVNPLYEKKMREHKEQSDLRQRLSSSRVDPQIVQTVKEHQALIAVAKEKLSGPASAVDVNTAKELHSMLNTILEQTNRLQNQLPRSVWDRIAPPENERSNSGMGVQGDILKGRFIQETDSQNILITAPSRSFGNEPDVKPPIQKKYHNIPPLEPNLVSPVCRPTSADVMPSSSFQKHPQNRYFGNKPQNQGNNWSREKPFERNRWNDSEPMRKATSPMRRQMSPMRHRGSPPRRFSPKRPMMAPPLRQNSPPRRHISPLRRPPSPFRMRTSPSRRPMSPPRRPMSPPRRQMSPPRRQMSPPGRPMSPPRRPMSPGMMRNDRRDIMPSHQLIPHDRQRISPPPEISMNQRRPQSPPRRPASPMRRFGDEWDIPSRGAVEQNMWRPTERMPEKTWRDERQSSANAPSSVNDRFRMPVNKDKWDIPDSSRGERWVGGGESWNKQQQQMQQMQQNSEKRWIGGSGPSTSGDNWNIHSKESFGKPSNMGGRDDWMDKNSQRWEPPQNKDSWNMQTDKDEWNDLPEDARDPWGDDGNLGIKDNGRWAKYDNPVASSSWVRESDKGDSWSKSNDSWQNKNQQHMGKPSQWVGNNQNMGESCWIAGNDARLQSEMQKKSQQMGGWQASNSLGSWPSQNTNYQQQQQRPFNLNPFKERR